MSTRDVIRVRIETFAAELEELVRAAAVQAVASALGAQDARVSTSVPRHAASPRARAVARSGGKRDPKVLAATVERAAQWIKANPGNGVEAMAKGMKVSTKDLALPVIKLLSSKRIRKTGVKRATKYFPR